MLRTRDNKYVLNGDMCDNDNGSIHIIRIENQENIISRKQDLYLVSNDGVLLCYKTYGTNYSMYIRGNPEIYRIYMCDDIHAFIDNLIELKKYKNI